MSVSGLDGCALNKKQQKYGHHGGALSDGTYTVVQMEFMEQMKGNETYKTASSEHREMMKHFKRYKPDSAVTLCN